MTKWHRNGEHPYGMVRWSDPTGNRMAACNGAGEINDLVELLDEYQLQVPNHFKKVWEFDTLEQADAFVAQMTEKKRVLDGHEYKKQCKDENGDKIKDKFEPILNARGKIEIVYCPVGEMVVKCVEQAARLMKSPVHITGAYLTGMNWATCH